jgi:hypothetical protein
MTSGNARPDWVMLGVPANGGFVVYASTDLDRAAIEREVSDDFGRALYTPERVVPMTSFRLTADMRRFVAVFGTTYAEALQRLLATWQPDQRPAISGVGALPR